MSVKDTLRRLTPAALRGLVHSPARCASFEEVGVLRQDIEESRRQLRAAWQQLAATQKELLSAETELAATEQALQALQRAFQANYVQTNNSLLQLNRALKEVRDAAVLSNQLSGPVTTALLNQRRALTAAFRVRTERDRPASYADEAARRGAYEIGFQKLRTEFPHAFAQWYPLLRVNADAYAGLPLDSCSMPGHPAATSFGSFLYPYLHGRVLDIGCGPQAVPVYLEDYPPALISGVDPLEPVQAHPFEFARGFAEHLPWKDGTFDVVIAATSLDHVLSVERTFDEIVRVLAPRGVFVAWLGFVREAPLYDPTDPNIKPVDAFHLFHFAQGWFEDMVGRRFDMVERLPLDLESCFYCLSAKKALACAA